MSESLPERVSRECMVLVAEYTEANLKSFWDSYEALQADNERLRRLLEPFADVAELAGGEAVFITYASGVRIETRPSIWSALREWEDELGDAADIAAIEERQDRPSIPLEQVRRELGLDDEEPHQDT